MVQFYNEGKNTSQWIKMNFVKGFSQRDAKTKQNKTKQNKKNKKINKVRR